MTEPTRSFLFALAYTAVGLATGVYMARVWPADTPERPPTPTMVPPPPAAPITVWLTRDALDKGIQEYQTYEPGPGVDLRVEVRRGNVTEILRYGPGEWHRTREAAVARAERMRAERVAEMEREIQALKAKEFRP